MSEIYVLQNKSASNFRQLGVCLLRFSLIAARLAGLSVSKDFAEACARSGKPNRLIPVRLSALRINTALMLMAGWLGATQLQAQSPGGVSTNLKLWLKADAITGVSNGGNVTAWSNSAVGTYALSSTGYTPPVFYNSTASNLVNFNPAVSYNGAMNLRNTTRLFASTSPFSLISVGVDRKASAGEVRGIMGLGVDGNYPAMDFQTDGISANGWNLWMSGSSPAEWSGGSGRVAGINGSSTTQANIVGVTANNASATINYSANNIISYLNGHKEATTLDAFQQSEIGNWTFVGSSGGENYNGLIPEVIVYDQQLSDTDMQKVQTYLAVKYGSTLGQTSSTADGLNSAGYTYLATDGTVLWNTSTNTGYNFSIFGIGRDDTEGLNQKQSKSQQPGAIVTIGNGTGIAATNAANTTNFPANLSYELVGDNGAPASYSTSYAPSTFSPVVAGSFYRMGRTWKVQETGIVGTVTISVPASTKAERLLVSGDGTFTPGSTQEIALTADGNGNLTATVNFNNGDYFSFGATAFAPGGVVANLEVWVKADAGIAAADGGNVTTWADQSLSSYDLIQPTAANQPVYRASNKLVNFNPSVDFSGTKYIRNDNPLMPYNSAYTFGWLAQDTNPNGGWRTMFSSEDAWDFFSVYKSDYLLGALNYNGWIPYSINGVPDAGYSGKGTIYGPLDNAIYSSGSNFTTQDPRTKRAQAQIFGMASNGAKTDPFYTWTDGYKDTPAWSPASELGPSTHFFQRLAVGSDYFGPNGAGEAEDFIGQINEFYAYSRTLSDVEMQKINTYMALKWGVTLGQGNGAVMRNANNVNYLATDGTVIWNATTNSGYSYNIAGIGKDVAEGLNQKQARSVHNYSNGDLVTMGLGTVAATNAANAGTFAADKSYEIWGDNGQPRSYSAVYLPTSFTPAGGVGFYRMAATWTVQETGTVGIVTVRVPVSSFAERMLVSSSASFPSGSTQEILLASDGSGYMAATFDFANGQYFTFGAAQKAPGGVASGLNMWLKADVLSGNDGDNVSNWQSSVLAIPYSVSQTTASQQPTLATSTTALVNFNQSLNFKRSAGQTMVNNTSALLSGDTPSFQFIAVGQDNDPTNLGAPYYGSANLRGILGNGLSGNNPAMDLQKDGAAPNGWNPWTDGTGEWFGGQATMYNSGGIGAATNTGLQPLSALTRIQNQQSQIFGLGFTWGSATLTPPSGTQSTAVINSYVDGWKEATNLKVYNNYATWTSTPYFSVGQSGGAEYWNGSINEIIQYTRELSAAEMQKVNTYLAIKYGVTIGQGGSSTALVGSNANSYNYLATDGSTVWNTSTNAGYNFDIAGIGLDNFEGLNQKQSQSVNATFQPAIGLSTVATTNEANANVFQVDKSYMIWGNNGQSDSYATNYTPHSFTVAAPVYLMNRIWKVQETGTVGTVMVSVPGSTTGTYLLVGSSPASLSGGTATEYAMTSDGNGNLVTTVDLTNGQYFTFGRASFAPGCVVPNLALWVKADAAGATIGSATTAWPDLSPNGRNVPAVGTMTVQTPDAAHNFQPYFSGFSSTNYFNDQHSVLGTAASQAAASQIPMNISVFAAVKPSTNSGTGHVIGIDNDDLFGGEPAFSLNAGRMDLYKFSAGAQEYFYTGAVTAGQSSVLSWQAGTSSGYDGLTMSLNGSPQTFALTNMGTVGEKLLIGYGTWSSAGAFDGDIQEVIWYNNGTGSMTTTQINQIESYLAIKYGTTLKHNYLSGSGTTIYDVSSYSANVTGVGRDDCDQLNQLQSKSGNGGAKMTISVSGTVAASNATNPGSFTADKSFLVLGDNGLTGTSALSAAAATGCPAPPLVDKYTNLAYKVTETGSVSAVVLQEDVSGFGFNTTFPIYMQVFSDAAFTSLLASVPMSYTNGVSTALYDFPANATSYIRFVGNTTAPANMCVAPTKQTFHWNGWDYGTKQKVLLPNYIPSSQSATSAMTMSVSVTDGSNMLLYRPSVDWWPVFDGSGLFIPRNDNSSTENNLITTRMQFRQGTSTSVVAAQTVDFMVYDVDGYIGGRDIVKIYGKQGSNTITPQLSQYKPTPFDALQLNYQGDAQQAIGSNIPWDLGAWGNIYVSFDQPVEEVFVEYRKDNTYGFNVYNDIRISPVTVTCRPPTPKAPLVDNVYIYKEVSPNPQKANERTTYKFTIQNTNCATKTVNLSDVLPGGLSWMDSTFVYSTSLTVGSVNNYGNTNTLTASNITVPPGTHYMYASVTGSNAGVYNNQASYVVTNGTGTTYLSDDPTVAGTTAQPTPLTLIANDPDANLTVQKTVNKATAPQNSTLTYTYTITNPNAGSAILTTFLDVLPGELTYIGGTLTGVGSATASPYSGSAVLAIRNLNVAGGSSLIFTVQASTNSYTVNAVANNIAQVTPDVLSGFRIKTVNSNAASTTIVAPPTVSIVSPANSTTTALNPTVSGTATPGSTVVLTSSTGTTLCSTTATAGGTWSCPVTLSAGPQTLSAVASNSNGTSSPATTQITAINTIAPLTASNPPALTATPGSTNSGNAATEILPSGGTAPYVYSNDTGNPSCSAVAGATQLPPANLTVASGTGSYSYIAPATPGVYYFCIKVCDSSTPTPSCVTKTYTLTVTAPAAVGTLDCSTAQITGLVAGTAGNGVLKLTINVTVAGAFPVTVSGSGMSASPSPYTINTASTGLQTFYVPLTYSGAAFGPTTITVTGAGVCSPDMSLVTPKTVSTSVLNLGPACTPVTAATLVK
ncbi:Ig-like domain-containing protein [Spirosoma pollinicola]|uniref:Uncharacterized protein n=1 Tax=Spirosoma pollinicola TaxID=2057025 RepID=A0A2K8Z8P5_9BACT|nr:Ig-like domain-containing protein [Spirosoma pollinicola]AUD06242.1 hypothetical protein CWM47_33005 [Spirosoma pollinicola]